jgi:tRNA (guanine-N7-)-methyltransferase
MNTDETPQPADGSIEYEFEVPIPGRILPSAQWTQTAYKKFPTPPLPLDFNAIFGRAAPLIVDLGCGNGRYTLLSALARPECNHFAIDVLPAVIRYATRRGNQRGLAFVRFGVKDAQTLVRQYLPANSVTEMHLYHPQPFHDRREAHKRVGTPQFLLNVHRALTPDGIYVFQTDSPEYWMYTCAIAGNFFDFKEHPTTWPDAPEGRTRREILSRSRGLKIYRGIGRPRQDVSPEAMLKMVKVLPPPNFKTRGLWNHLDEEEAGTVKGEAEE